MKKLLPLFCLIVLTCWLTACGESNRLAPIEEPRWRPFSMHAKQYVVRRGDTLFAIAFRYDKDYHQLAAANHIRPPYALRVGQVISLKEAYSQPHYRPVSRAAPYAAVRRPARPMPARPIARTPMYASPVRGQWLWPAQGRVIAGFAPALGNKGINIAGSHGDRIRASAAGVVAYAGNGLSGYGNLIIIKHNNQFLTAYGNNARNLVREGQRVSQGQVIAEMGLLDRTHYGVHFEIRSAGKPVNPLNFIQKG